MKKAGGMGGAMFQSEADSKFHSPAQYVYEIMSVKSPSSKEVLGLKLAECLEEISSYSAFKKATDNVARRVVADYSKLSSLEKRILFQAIARGIKGRIEIGVEPSCKLLRAAALHGERDLQAIGSLVSGFTWDCPQRVYSRSSSTKATRILYSVLFPLRASSKVSASEVSSLLETLLIDPDREHHARTIAKAVEGLPLMLYLCTKYPGLAFARCLESDKSVIEFLLELVVTYQVKEVVPILKSIFKCVLEDKWYTMKVGSFVSLGSAGRVAEKVGVTLANLGYRKWVLRKATTWWKSSALELLPPRSKCKDSDGSSGWLPLELAIRVARRVEPDGGVRRGRMMLMDLKQKLDRGANKALRDVVSNILPIIYQYIDSPELAPLFLDFFRSTVPLDRGKVAPVLLKYKSYEVHGQKLADLLLKGFPHKSRHPALELAVLRLMGARYYKEGIRKLILHRGFLRSPWGDARLLLANAGKDGSSAVSYHLPYMFDAAKWLGIENEGEDTDAQGICFEILVLFYVASVNKIRQLEEEGEIAFAFGSMLEYLAKRWYGR